MSTRNKYGLLHEPDAPTARAVRQRCGFGCAVCGTIPFEYHHFDPEFREAHAHDPNGIVLLCERHHNATKSRPPSLTLDQVREASVNPYAKRPGHVPRKFSEHWVSEEPSFFLGSNRITKGLVSRLPDGETPIPIFAVNVPEGPGSSVRITANLFDDDGGPMVVIQENHWKFLGSRYDIDETGNKLEIRKKRGHVILRLTMDGVGEVYIETLRSKLPNGRLLEVRDGTIARLPGEGSGGTHSWDIGCTYDWMPC